MRLRTRTFLLCFAPVALLMSLSFWTVQRLVESTVRNGLRAELRKNHQSIVALHEKTELQNSRYLRIVGENPALKAGAALMAAERDSPAALRLAARRTVEDQLREMGARMGFDFLMLSAPDGAPLAAVRRSPNGLIPADVTGLRAPGSGLMPYAGSSLRIASVPIDLNEENIGLLAVGEYFAFNGFSSPAVLLRDGRVIQSNIRSVSPAQLNSAFAGCPARAECDVRLAGAAWISLPIDSVGLGDSYVLRSLQNVDEAAAPLRGVLRRVFAFAAAGVALLAFFGSLISARSIVRPIGSLVGCLRKAETTGVLPEFAAADTGLREIRELSESFGRAAVSVRVAQEGLQSAYLEFVGSLANALDARDPYTAGHSARVSALSQATAAALGLPDAVIHRIRIGALLHDIGKMGVADRVLQKPGRLTDDEFDLVRRHPGIGRRILESVHGFSPYLAAVELHHENWDGSGYPQGRKGDDTPVDARIVHIADAYDAMTTDRPYRRGMARDEALRIILENAGTQFDPAIARCFVSTQAEAPETIAQEMAA